MKETFVRSYRGGRVDWFSQKRIRAYRVGGLVGNAIILSVRTLWMTPRISETEGHKPWTTATHQWNSRQKANVH